MSDGLGNIFTQYPNIEEKTVFWVNGNDFFTCYSPLIARITGKPFPRASYQLGFMAGGATLKRTGDNRLLITQDLASCRP